MCDRGVNELFALLCENVYLLIKLREMKNARLLLACLIGLLLTEVSAGQAPVKLENGVYLGADGIQYNGEIRAYREDGSLRSMHTVVSGQLDGPARFYGESEKLEETGSYRQGEKHGIWQRFNISGLLVGEAFYKASQKDGIWTVWDDQGVKRYHMVYSMGKKIDVWQMWDQDANLVSEKVYSN